MTKPGFAIGMGRLLLILQKQNTSEIILEEYYRLLNEYDDRVFIAAIDEILKKENIVMYLPSVSTIIRYCQNQINLKDDDLEDIKKVQYLISGTLPKPTSQIPLTDVKLIC